MKFKKIISTIVATVAATAIAFASTTPAMADFDSHNGGGKNGRGRYVEFYWEDESAHPSQIICALMQGNCRNIAFRDPGDVLLVQRYNSNPVRGLWAKYDPSLFKFNPGRRGPFVGGKNQLVNMAMSHEGLVEEMQKTYHGGFYNSGNEYVADGGRTGIDMVNLRLGKSKKTPMVARDQVLITVEQDGYPIFDRAWRSARYLYEHGDVPDVPFSYKTKKNEFQMYHTIRQTSIEVFHYFTVVGQDGDEVIEDEHFETGATITEEKRPFYNADIPSVDRYSFKPWNLNTMQPEEYRGAITPLRAKPFHDGKPSNEALKTTDTNIAKDFTLQLNDQLGLPHSWEGGFDVTERMPPFSPEINRKSKYYNVTLHAGTLFHDRTSVINDRGRESVDNDLIYKPADYGTAPRAFGFKSIKATGANQVYELGNRQGLPNYYWLDHYYGVKWYDYGAQYRGYVSGGMNIWPRIHFQTGLGESIYSFQGGWGRLVDVQPSPYYPGLARWIAKTESQFDQPVLSGQFKVGSLGGDNEKK